MQNDDPLPKDRGPAGGKAHPAARGAGLVGLAVGALGVVFGDIGTSPLYALQTVFSIEGGKVKPTTGDVYGVISLIFWSITLVVSIKYVAFILRADNDGEGGVMALAALARRSLQGRRTLVGFALILGVLGASLFYGDSVITPAISVLSAVEGLQVISPDFKDAVLPVGIAILTLLFVAQRLGTHKVGRAFGPIMVLWFVVLAVTGLAQVIKHPDILRALSPTYIGTFVADHPYLTFIALGAVVLAITGAEALYADMGHFGRAPIRRAWFFVVFPALTLNYLGQGALVLNDKKAISSPFFLMAPHWARVPLVVLATVATVIASQAVISGAYSVSRQAVRLGFLPNLTVRHTSKEESGQIYVPGINWLLFGGVLILILAFRSSQRLATAYGLAVTGTFLITTTLFLIVAGTVWHWAKWKLIVVGVVFGGVELSYFGANAVKVVSGGWLPLVIAAAIVTVMTTWQRGREIVTKRRAELEGPLQDFVDELQHRELQRVPGVAVFPHPTKETTPLALRANVDFNHVLHEHVVLVSVRSENIPYIPIDKRIEVDPLEYADDGVVHIDVRFGFQDDQDIPEMLRHAVGKSAELQFEPDDASYFLSRLTIQHGEDNPSTGMARWRKRLFIGLAHNAANPALNFSLPEDRTVVMGAHLEL
ncbi:potassium transporter Kup [uncultured Jatrophihabitans sp.]|uniref:potassium transporter Kup n=1 Tax=uncultured Jatrophihabitans sp. TaxID=1610747 RepID=UPI0035CA2BBB